MIQGGCVTVTVVDLDRAVHFYGEVLGLEVSFRLGDHWAELDAGMGLRVALHRPRCRREPTGTGAAIGFGVDGPIGQEMERLESVGVTFEGGLHRDPDAPVLIARFRDPDENPLYLWQLA